MAIVMDQAKLIPAATLLGEILELDQYETPDFELLKKDVPTMMLPGVSQQVKEEDLEKELERELGEVEERTETKAPPIPIQTQPSDEKKQTGDEAGHEGNEGNQSASDAAAVDGECFLSENHEAEEAKHAEEGDAEKEEETGLAETYVEATCASDKGQEETCEGKDGTNDGESTVPHEEQGQPEAAGSAHGAPGSPCPSVTQPDPPSSSKRKLDGSKKSQKKESKEKQKKVKKGKSKAEEEPTKQRKMNDFLKS